MELPVELDELLRREDASVEWKEGVFHVEDIVRKLTAFANNFTGQIDEGWVVCGIEETKNGHGFPRARPVGLTADRFKEVRGRVSSLCRQRVSPPLVPQIYDVPVDDDPSRRILVFHITASPYLHAFRTRDDVDRYWILTDSSTIEARGELLQELLRRKQVAPPFLEQPCPEATLDDLQQLAAEEFMKEARLPLPASEYLEPDVPIDALARPLVVSKTLAAGATAAVPTFLALLLFGRLPTRFIPGAYLVFSVYDGVSRDAPHSQRSEVAGALPKVAHDVLEKLRLYTGIEIDKTADAVHGSQNNPRYSDQALQEALVNALVHRDYESREPTRVTVFSNRIEISNPGEPFPAVDRKQLEEGRAPIHWRNPALAGFLLRMKLAQNEGQGLPTILRETLAVAGRLPEIRADDGFFTVVLPAFQALPEPARDMLRPPRNGSGADGLILVSIGAPSVRSVVEGSLEDLSLEETEILVDFAMPDYVDPGAGHWDNEARRLRDGIRERVEDPGFARFHLFYRGPVVLAPLLGALIAPVKPLFVYYYQDGRYELAYVLDRRFLKSRD